MKTKKAGLTVLAVLPETCFVAVPTVSGLLPVSRAIVSSMLALRVTFNGQAL